MKITVDLEKINLMVVNAGDLIKLTPEADAELQKLLELQKTVADLVKKAQSIIEEKGLEYDSNFKSVDGEFVKARYRAYGQKYYLEEDKIDQIPSEMFVKKVTTKYSPVAKIIEIWAEKNGALPYGIIEPERKKTLSLTLLNDNDTTED